MVSVFDLDQLQSLLEDFHRITNIRITVFDSQLNELVSYPEQCAPFCRLIRATAPGRTACARCDREACAALGVEVVDRPVSTVENGYVRHHPGHLARELILLHAERSVRIAGEGFNYARDTYHKED